MSCKDRTSRGSGPASDSERNTHLTEELPEDGAVIVSPAGDTETVVHDYVDGEYVGWHKTAAKPTKRKKG